MEPKGTVDTVKDPPKERTAPPLIKLVDRNPPPPEPPIEHVSLNYISLQNVVCGTVEKIGKELANLLRTASSVPNDAVRKRQFFDFLVQSRQELVKIYVLCKWSAVSNEISKSIDVSNWLRGQLNCYGNVLNALMMLQQSLSQAKAVPADLDTAIRVYKYGNPELIDETKYFMPQEKLSDREVLNVLKQLDVLLTVRLALHEDLPIWYRDYVINDGRVKFNLPFSSFWAEFSVADDEVGQQSKFFLVDFGSVDSSLDLSFRYRLEMLVNGNQLRLVEILDCLSLFAANFKLQSIERELRKLEYQAGPWAGVISHFLDPQDSKLVVKYFTKTADPQSFTLMLSTSKPYTLICEPFCPFNQSSSAENLVPKLLHTFTHNRAVDILSKLHAPWINRISDLQLVVQLTNSVSTELRIETTSGNFVLSGKGSWLLRAQNDLNSGKPPMHVLQNLRVQACLETMALRASTVGWIPQRNLRLAPDEWKKLENCTDVLMLKLKNTLGWCLCLGMGAQTEPRWFATRVECSHNRWYLGPLHKVETNFDVSDPDYASLVHLMEKYTVLFVLFELVHELTDNKIKHTIQPEQRRIIIQIDSVIPGCSIWAHTGLVCVVLDKKIEIEGRARKGMLLPLGNIDQEFCNSQIIINAESSSFKITTKQGKNQLQNLQAALGAVHNAAKSFISTAKLGLEVTGATLNSLEIKYAEKNGLLSVHNGTKLLLTSTNPQYVLSPFLPEVGAEYSLVQLVTFLKEWYPVWDFFSQLNKTDSTKSIVAIPQTMNSVRVQLGYDVDAPSLEISYRRFRQKKAVNFVVAKNGAENIKVINSWFTELKNPGVVPLMTGCVIDIGAEEVLMEMIRGLAAVP